MFTVLIVEDEVFVSMGLRNMIRWSELDMTVIGEARTGKEGLEMYYQKKPDVILADIKMPVMNGIDMITRIREEDTATKIVVLSSHEDYEYVRQAFRLGITDYILKVKMLPEDIEAIMKKVRNELLEEAIQKEKKDDEREKESDREEQMEKYKQYIIHRSVSLEEFTLLAEMNSLKEDGLIICLMGIFPQNKEASEENMEGKRHITLELIGRLLSEKKHGLILWESGNQYLLLFSLGNGPLSQKELQLKEILTRIRSMTGTYLNANAVIGCSSFADSFDSLHRLYKEALQVKREAVFLEEEILFYDIEKSSQKGKETLIQFEQKISQTKWITDPCRQKIIKELTLQKNMDRMDIDMIRESFSRWIHRVSFDSAVQKKETLDIVLEAAHQMRGAVSLPELVGIFEKYLDTMSEVKESKLVSSEIAAAVQYIKKHYYEENICLSEVAWNVGLSKDYLSSLFKRDIGQGFSDYVNRMRINRACELLENTTLKAYEISQAVGFQDESYFSRVFKKMVGMRPNEYRRCELDSEKLRQEAGSL